MPLPARRVRIDGWTGERKARFIETLAACGVVADAARAAGMSVASAYALRNRRAGRAWGAAWDAVLIHRARGRMSDELVSRAMDGCTETITRNGEEWGTRHRHDNRLAMAVLTRLDRLAELPKSDADAETLHALSEDLDEFIDCIEADSDADAFVEARRPPAPAPPPAPRMPPDDLDLLATIAGCSNYRDVVPTDIDVSDLSPNRQGDWSSDAWVRAERSFYLDWLDMAKQGGTLPDDPDDCPAEFMRIRAEIVARMGAAEAEADGEEDGGTADGELVEAAETDATQPSTSST